jgi:membrane fusion protein (multidrug efflux system)
MLITNASRHFMRKLVLTVPAGFGLLLALVSCGGQPPQATSSGPQTYPVLTLRSQSATIYTDYPAVVQGQQTIELRPRIAGYVAQIYVDEGATVRRGQMLFRIDAPQYQQEVANAAAAVTSAESSVSAARLQVNKTRPLVEKDIISDYELEAAEYGLKTRQAALTQSRTQLANARTTLGYAAVTSPVDGVVGTIPYRLGSLVSSTSEQPLTTVASTRRIYAYFSLNEKQLLEFTRSAPGRTAADKLRQLPAVALQLADGTAYPEPGHVETINGLLNAATGSASLRAAFANTTGLLRSGGSATVRMPRVVVSALLVPQKATFELQGKRFVYVVDSAGKVHSTEIQPLEGSTGEFFVVQNGLKTGDRIVSEGVGSLQDGQQIAPAPVGSAPTAAR